MKKLFAALSLMCIPALAQVGIVRSTSGIHAPSAKTLPQGFLYISGAFEMVSDGNPLSLEGGYTDSKGNFVPLEKNTPSNDETFYASFAVLDNLELGVSLPFHYEGDINNTDLDGFGLGDLHLSAKGSIPVNEWFYLGLSGELFAPTGSTKKGFRPRHRWYVKSDGETFAFTSNYTAANVNVHFSFDLRQYLTFNGYVGLLSDVGEKGKYLLWGAGFNIFPEKTLTLILEASGETPMRSTRMSYHFLNSPFRLTPGLRLHLPYDAYLTLSGDIGFHYFKDLDIDDALSIDLKTDKSNLHYRASGSPEVAIAISLSKVFNLSWGDDDNDGVIDRKDMCPNTFKGQKVNPRGCPVDEDQDGILNIVDLCPNTPTGLEVDYNGCPLDHDNDGVADYLDKCPNTKSGFAVDSTGCMLDTDGDGIDDNNDKCHETPHGEPVGNDGCPLDQDKDGIPNETDQCPDTPEGISIDKNGCPLDFDGDGVPDDIDNCPNSKLGELVGESGCPLDSDKDGVPDTKDECADTPEGVTVNILGCRIDQDGDGIFDEEDKCPGTPEGAPIDSLGCPLDSDEDGIADWADQCPGTAPNTFIDISGCPTNQRHNFNTFARHIRFKGIDTVLVNSSYTALNDIVYYMRQYPMNLEIQCSASEAGANAERISNERAEFIYNYLVKKGIRKERLKFQGFGKKLPPTLTQKSGSTDVVRFIPSPENQKQ